MSDPGEALWSPILMRGRRTVCPSSPRNVTESLSWATIWQRTFSVCGAVAGTVGCLGAMEAIKVLSGLGEPLLGKLLTSDLRGMTFHKATIKRRPGCPLCGHLC